MPRVKVAIGVEPDVADAYDEAVDERMRDLAQAGEAHAIGACGLVDGADERQASAFRRQVAIAREFGLPLVVTANGAHGDARDVLEREGFPLDRVLVQLFRGSDDELLEWTRAGAFVSFGGWSADDPMGLCHQVSLVPADRVLVESGAPQEALDLLAGFPARCDQVVHVASAIGAHVSAQQLYENFERFYTR